MDSCGDIKRKIIEKFNCSFDTIKVAKLDNQDNPSCYKIIGDLEESSEHFYYKYKKCSIMVEHKHQGMRFY